MLVALWAGLTALFAAALVITGDDGWSYVVVGTAVVAAGAICLQDRARRR